MTRALRILPCLLAVLAPLPAMAQQKPPQEVKEATTEAKTDDQRKAQEHFQRAKDLYAGGSYREAIAELEAARVLDPKAKDLVFNLGIVHEKLQRYDEAIVFFRQYLEMESVTAAERVKAENIVKRIEGAKRELPVAPPSAPSNAPTPPPATPAEEPPRGRVDAATITAGSIAVVGLGVGAIFGILAVSSKPSSDFVTGRDGTFGDLQSKSDRAHTQAIVADVGLGIGVVAALATAYLYFGRTRDPAPAVAPSASPVRGGGVFLLGGSFR
ncbi:MAG: tetratricopeptide repeat protein [Labilithrix sp.]|nr:tetratricopeptide repeat protein [Labilithrix sp.]